MQRRNTLMREAASDAALALFFFFALQCATAQTAAIPAEDARRTQIVTTRTQQPLPNYAALDAWQKRRTFLRNQILVATGLSPLPPKNDLHAEVFGKIEGQGYTVEKVLLETFPGFYLGGNLYRPTNAHAKHPGIVNPHGHWPYGRLEHEPTDSGPALGISLARQGYVVFAYDMVGYTDTLQLPHRFGSDALRLWGLGPLGLQLWDSIRALDFLSSLPDVDTADLGATGASGGASQSFLLAAVDDRLSFLAPVSMISSFMQGGDLCESAPGLRLGSNNVEMAATFAPKPMLIVAGTQDWTRNTLRDEYPAIRGIYALYGKTEAVEATQITAPHNFNRESREAVYRFFAKIHPGLTDPKELTEHNIEVPMIGQMSVLYNHALPANAVDLRGLFAGWRAMAEAQNAAPQDARLQRERLRQTLAVEFPAQVAAAHDKEKIVLTSGHGDRVAGVEMQGRGPLVIVLHAEGSTAALAGTQAALLRRQGRALLALDLFETGAAKAPRDRKDKPLAEEDPGVNGGPRFLTYNVSDDQARVQDILTAIAYASRKAEPVEIYATGSAALWASFAAAVSPTPVRLHTEAMTRPETDEDYIEHCNIAGLRRAGGLAIAEKLAAQPR